MNETADEILTALLDGQLAEPDRAELFRRLATEAALQARFVALARTREQLDAGFSTLLAHAPVMRLPAALPARPELRRTQTTTYARLAASVVVVALLGALLAAWIIGRPSGVEDDWTTAVVDYMQLYTSETFAELSPDATLETALVAKVGSRMGVDVTSQDLVQPGLTFKTAFVLSYDSRPLGEFVYADGVGRPYLFCILADPAGPLALRMETRRGYAMAIWGRGEKRFLVIGPSADVIRDWSKRLADRV